MYCSTNQRALSAATPYFKWAFTDVKNNAVVYTSIYCIQSIIFTLKFKLWTNENVFLFVFVLRTKDLRPGGSSFVLADWIIVVTVPVPVMDCSLIP